MAVYTSENRRKSRTLRLLTMQHSACFLLTSDAFRRAICIVAQRPLAKGYILFFRRHGGYESGETPQQAMGGN